MKKIRILIKTLLMLLFPVMIYIQTAEVQILLSAILTITMIGCISYLIGYRWKKISRIVNGVLSLSVFVQYLVRYYANSYISMQMLTNLASIEAISGKFHIYIPCAVTGIIVSFIPVRLRKMRRRNLTIAACLLLVVTLNFSVLREYNVYYEYYKLYVQKTEMDKMSAKIAEYNSSDIVSAFYKERTDNYVSNDLAVAMPNVILIFTEGLSQNIIEDERNITPNFRRLESESLYFDNYYNHTFATYMGLSGQLYSGFQKSNYDDNRLVSLQDIMKLNGYGTYFINTEPENNDFSAYLEQMRFDEIITDSEKRNGANGTISDKDAYELLFETALEKENEGTAFLLGIYTFGTHTNLDSADLKFGDEKNFMLNRAYNADYYFGEFLKKFNESSLADNTILVFTTDHASYADNDFLAAFPEYKRASSICDEIPLCIYYKGIEPQVIDAKGRNSLDLTPTICDYVNLVGENYFLGTSLFADDVENKFDTRFQSDSNYLSTENAVISPVEAEALGEFKDLLAMYFAAKLLDETIYDEYDETTAVSVCQDGENLIIDMTNMEDVAEIKIAVWSTYNGQDDIQWYSFKVRHKDKSCRISLLDFEELGEYNCHVYGYDKKEEQVFLFGQLVYVVDF